MLGVGPALVTLVTVVADGFAAPADEAGQCVTVAAIDDHQLALEVTTIPTKHVDDKRKVGAVRTVGSATVFLDELGRDARCDLPSDHFPVEAGEQCPLQRNCQC